MYLVECRFNFYPRSPCGERQRQTYHRYESQEFLSTLSLRRATPVREIIQWEGIFLSTLSLRRATGCWMALNRLLRFLSTLSLRRATHYDNYNLHCVEISIHALLAESDVEKVPADVYYQAFLSTLSLRRATISCAWSASKLGDFYPRSPCGERLHYDNYNLHCVEISIHALLAESDACLSACVVGAPISIHALLAESDR